MPPGVEIKLWVSNRSAVDDHVMARVVTVWSITNRTAQPVMIAAAGALAAVTGVRPALPIDGLICLTSGLFLPWTCTRHVPSPISDSAVTTEV
jgi:hypothetical protein